MPEFTPTIQALIDKHFPPETHPYRLLEEQVESYLSPDATASKSSTSRCKTRTCNC